MTDQLPPGGFGAVPRPRQTHELRVAGERERATARAAADAAARKDVRRLPPRVPQLARIGDREPRRLDPWKILPKVSPGALAHGFATIVPPSRVRRDDLSCVATITCACNASIEVSPERSALCGCGRLFLDLGDQVRVCKTEEPSE